MATVLILDASLPEQSTLPAALQALGHETLVTGVLHEALETYDQGRCDLAICELIVPGGGGLTFLHRVRGVDRTFPIILTTDRPDLATSPLFLHGMGDANAKILKNAPIFEFAEAIRRLCEGDNITPAFGIGQRQHASDWIDPRS